MRRRWAHARRWSRHLSPARASRWLSRALAAGLVVAVVAVASACSGDDDDPPASSTPAATVTPQAAVSAAPTATRAASTPRPGDAPTIDPNRPIAANTGRTVVRSGGAEPRLSIPASRYSAGEQEIAIAVRASVADTLPVNSELFSALGPFSTREEGMQFAATWKYVEGFTTTLEPDGLLAGVLLGRYYVLIETHLFETADGAKAAFEKYVTAYNAAPRSEEQAAPAVGNESALWRLYDGKVGPSTTDAVYYRQVFRRGNLLAVVQTIGAAPLMTGTEVAAVAAIIDQKATGGRPAGTPTPRPTAVRP